MLGLRSRVASLAITVATVSSMACVAEDAYGLEPVVAENVTDVAEHLARGGGNPVSGVGCGTRCADWWLKEHQPIPNQPSSEQLHRELRTLRTSHTKVLPALRLLGPLALAAETGYLGFKLGRWANTKFLKVGIPQPMPWSAVTDQRIAFVAEGSILYGSWTMPYDAWRWQWGVGGSWSTGVWRTPNEPSEYGCNSTVPPAAPEGFIHLTAEITCGQPAPLPAISATGHVAVLPEDSLPAVSAIEDYVDQPYEKEVTWWPERPTSATALQARAQQALDSGAFPMAEAWYAHQLEPENYPDPTTTENWDHSCDATQPAYKNPGGSTDPEPHTEKLAIPFETQIRPSGAGSAPDPYLRWGLTTWDGSFIDNWGGWGWRHIQAKHGWSTTDETETRAALLGPASTFEQNPTSMAYTGQQFTRNGALCERKVVVEYGEGPFDPPGKPKGIITSYAQPAS
jgi:hypothetical protein